METLSPHMRPKLHNLHRESLMAYKLNKTNGTLLVDLIHGTIDINSTTYTSRKKLHRLW